MIERRVGELAVSARTVDASTSLAEAALCMARWHVGSLIVVEDGEPIGIVTDRDLALHALLEESGGSVRDCASTPVATIDSEASIGDAVERMRQARTRRLLVRGGPDAALGVLAADDVLQDVSRSLFQIADVVRRELRREATPGSPGPSPLGPE